MAKKSRKASKSTRKTTTRLAEARNVQSGFAAMTSGLVQMAMGIGPKFTKLPADVHNSLKGEFAKRGGHVLKGCGTSMAAKFIIFRVPGPKR